MTYNKWFFIRGLTILILLTITPVTVFAQSLSTTVYISTNQGRKYHVNKDCGHLKRCSLTLKAVSLKEAIDGQKTNNGIVHFSCCMTCSKRFSIIEEEYKNGKIKPETTTPPPPEIEKSNSPKGTIGKGGNIGKYKNN